MNKEDSKNNIFLAYKNIKYIVSGVKISLITVCYNAAGTIERCIKSVAAQNYSCVEYIIIDGASVDDTLKIIKLHHTSVNILVSEPDAGLYDAMNKGIALATGDVIGILNADDYFATNDVLAHVAHAFEQYNSAIVYGNIDLVNSTDKIIRKWRSGKHGGHSFKYGWMPPHASFYVRSNAFKLYGNYSTSYGTAADYELMLRFMFVHNLDASYLDIVMVKMQLGGVSNGTIMKRVRAWTNDYKAMRTNGLPFPLFALVLKPLRKIQQYVV